MITDGEEQAEIIAFTDDGLQIRTSIKGTVKQTVSRLNENLGRYVTVSGGVREFLNAIRSGLEMPWALRSMTDAQIIEVLKNRAGVSDKVQEIDSRIKVKETARADVGRDKKRLGERGKPPEETEHPPKIDELKTERETAIRFLKIQRETLDKAAEYIRAKCFFETLDGIPALKAAVDEAYQCAKKRMEETGKPYTQADVDRMDRRFMEWNTEEEKAKAWDAYGEKKQVIERLAAHYETLTGEIETLRELREKTLSGIALIKGLEIGENTMLYHNGVLRGITDSNTVDNWSTAESVQVFFSIGAAFSGEMKVLVVDNAESLDGNTTKAISQWAEKSACLVILLKVADLPDDLEEGIIYLKEGEVITA